MQLSPVFIIGSPRSGTTLLSKLLKPTDYGEPVETHFIVKYFKRLSSYGDLSRKTNFSKLIADILSERAVSQWKLDIDIDKLWSEMSNFDYREIVDQICRMRPSGKNKLSWGDKTPTYIFNFEVVYNLFPDAKYIYIIRDGRDVALSLLGRPWGPNNLYACARYWKKSNHENPVIQNLLQSSKMLFIRYEDLLKEPESVIREIYEYLDQRYDETEINPLISSIKTNNFNKWQQRLKQNEVKLFENLAANTLIKFGYETSYPERNVNPLIRMCYTAHDRLIFYKHLIKINTIDTIKIKYFGMEPFNE